MYEKPVLEILGSITKHTFGVGYPGHQKGGTTPPNHLDKFCEWSGGSGDDLCTVDGVDG